MVLRRRLERLVNSSPMIMRLLASTAAATNRAKRSAPSVRQRFMPRPRIKHGNAPLDAGTEALALLECRRSFVSLALRRLAAATLRNARHRDAAARADGEVVLAEEAAIGAVELRGAAESMAAHAPSELTAQSDGFDSRRGIDN